MELKHGDLTNIYIKTYLEGNAIFEEIGEMIKIRKIINNVIREKK